MSDLLYGESMSDSIYNKLMKSKDLSDKMVERTKVREYISTNVIVLNLLFSGRVRGGIPKGMISQISADSALGKSMIGLSILREAQRKGMECAVIDTERSWDWQLAEAFGIDTNKLPVLQTGEIAKIKQAISEMSEGKNRAQRENTFILFDSWGRLVSQVILDKAAEGSTARDMSLPFWKNELANIMAESDMTYFVINHVYANTGGFGDPLSVPGGKRLYFNSDGIVMCMGGAKDKESDEIVGKIVTATAKKGRKAIEFSKLKYRLNHDGGLDMFYGLLDDALEHGCIVAPKQGRYSRPCVPEDKAWKEADIYTPDFWIPILKNTDFEKFLSEKYSYVGRDMDVKNGGLEDLLSA